MRFNINKLLKQQNKSKSWLAKQVGITYPNLCNITNNKTKSIKLDILEKILSALNCSLDDLFCFDNNIKHNIYFPSEKKVDFKIICDSSAKYNIQNNDIEQLIQYTKKLPKEDIQALTEIAKRLNK